MYNYAIVYFLHTLWSYLKGINYSYSSNADFILQLTIGILFNLSLGIIISSFLKSKKARFIGHFIVIFILCLLFRYLYRFGSSFDLAIAFDNFSLLFSTEGVLTAAERIKIKDYLIGFTTACLLGYLNTKIPLTVINFKIKALSYLTCTLILIFSPIQNEESIKLIYSGVHYFFPKNFRSKNYNEILKLSPRKVQIRPINSKKPNIIIILLESYSFSYIGKTTSEGKEITPVMNRLYKNELSIPFYYSPTIQTIKAQYSLLCSKIPYIKNKASFSGPESLRRTCLPWFMNELNYQSIYYQSSQDLNFDNTGKFMKKIGFNDISVAPINLLSKNQRKSFIWGWGLQDDKSFPYFLEKIENQPKNKHIFALMNTISHHMNFNKVPGRLEFLYPKTKNKTEMFQNSLHLSDLYLQTFLDEMKARGLDQNSLIFITADHSYPSGEHGNHNSELGAWEENFRIPMVILGPKHLLPKINPELVYSHYDLLPTILSAAGYSGSITSIGESMYLKNKNSPTPLIQPYDGLKIRFPMGKTSFVWSASADETNTIKINPTEKIIETTSSRKLVQNFLDFTFAELELSRN